MGTGETINDGSASSDGEFVTNGKESEYARDDINGIGSVERYEEEDNELDKPISFIHGLDLRNLLGSSDKKVKTYSDGGSRFIENKNFLAGIILFSCYLELKTFIEIF